MTASGSDLVSVIVPVYDGPDEIEACLTSLLTHARTTKVPFELILVDDASPAPAVAARLDQLVGAPTEVPVRLIRNATNLGFVASVNLGMAASSGDVVLLNADTVVTEGWLDRLAAAAGTEADVATVTPLTNHGSICTLPPSIIDAFDLDGEAPQIDECAAFIAHRSAGMRPDVISGVGFCMYVTRRALDWCGPFDEATFGRGYGEEVDFCLKTSRLGLRHLVEDSTYVHHHGGVSFGDDSREAMQTASKRLHRRYHWFREVNRRERADDPLLVTFTALELGLVARDERRPHVLHILHGTPDDVGGTEKHLDSLLDALADEFDFSILFPIESGFVLRTRWTLEGGGRTTRELLLPGPGRWVTDLHDGVAGEALATALDLFDFDVVHIQNLIRHSLAPLDVLAGFDGHVIVSVHDMFLACPHYSLLYRDEQACGLPDDLTVCARCLPETEGRSVDELEAFRRHVADHLDAVDSWVFASQSSADYLTRVYDIDPARVHLVPHGTTTDPDRRWPIDDAALDDEPLRLAFVGRGSAKKGLALADRLACDLADSSIEVHHFGELVGAASGELHLHGPYDNQILGDLLHQTGIQIVLLPGSYAETFGLVMTEALIAGLPVIGASFGALGERIRADGVGWTIDPADPAQLRELVERLDQARWEVRRAAEQATSRRFETVAATAPRYASLYRAGIHDRDDEGER